MNIAILYILISVLGSAMGQLLLLWQMVTNPNVFFGLAIYLVGTIFWLAALSRVDLSFAYPFASFNYVIMLVASWMMFDEKITVSRLLGTVVIGIGVVLISRN